MIAVDAPLTEQAETIDRVWNLFLGLGLVVLALVAGLMLWVIVRYRKRSDDGPHDLPPQKHYNIPMEVTYIVIPLAIVLGLFAVTFVTVDAIDDDDPDPDLVVDVIAFQWQWRFDYPDSGVSITGEPGEFPELVLPASSTVRFDLTSLDVIHSFWIPAFRFKRDMIPGTPRLVPRRRRRRGRVLPEHGRVRRVLRARPLLDAILGADPAPRRVRAVVARPARRCARR